MCPAEVRPLEGDAVEGRLFQDGASKVNEPTVGALAFPARLTSPTNHRQNGRNIRRRRVPEFFLLGGLAFGRPVWPAGPLPQEIGASRYPLLEVLRCVLGFVPAQALSDEGRQVLNHRPVIVRAFLRK